MFNLPLIHIGYHKSGTSFLQEKVFEQFLKTFYRVNQKLIGQYFIEPTPFHFDEKAVQNFCKNEINKEASTFTVFSNERISGSPHTGDFNSKYVADRLAECLPNAKVLIVIREQEDMIRSSYAQYLKARGSYGIQEYLMPKDATFFRLNSLKYHFLIDYYFQLFGKSNVLVLPYEFLRNSPETFLTRFFHFLELEPEKFLSQINTSERVNKALKPVQLQVKRYFNPFIMENFQNAGSTFNNKLLKLGFSGINRFLSWVPTKKLDNRIDLKIKNTIQEYTNSRFAYSNSKTSKMIGIDLGNYGYQVQKGEEG
jgi:hypothetical protein